MGELRRGERVRVEGRLPACVIDPDAGPGLVSVRLRGAEGLLRLPAVLLVREGEPDDHGVVHT